MLSPVVLVVQGRTNVDMELAGDIAFHFLLDCQ
jgi:hypothetical protein